MRQVIKLTLFCLVVSPLLFAADYRFVKIDFPNATQTLANGINARGDIVGRYLDAEGVGHGYLLRKGVFSAFDFPHATLTAAFALNAQGDIVGRFTDANGTDHGFLLTDGKFTQIDYPGASGTWARGINNAGDIVGSHFDPVGIEHGFLLKDGTFLNIHVPGSSCEHVGMAQDNGRVVVGSFCNTPDGMLYGFVRNRQGEFQTINFPGSGLICTGARWINERGDVVGPYTRVNNPDECLTTNKHGYLMREGQFVAIDPPAAVDSQPDAINDDGQIVGIYTDDAGVIHGYQAIPKDER
jgi:probable HAF family extracellular repeat protein